MRTDEDEDEDEDEEEKKNGSPPRPGHVRFLSQQEVLAVEPDNIETLRLFFPFLLEHVDATAFWHSWRVKLPWRLGNPKFCSTAGMRWHYTMSSAPLAGHPPDAADTVALAPMVFPTIVSRLLQLHSKDTTVHLHGDVVQVCAGRKRVELLLFRTPSCHKAYALTLMVGYAAKSAELALTKVAATLVETVKSTITTVFEEHSSHIQRNNSHLCAPVLSNSVICSGCANSGQGKHEQTSIPWRCRSNVPGHGHDLDPLHPLSVGRCTFFMFCPGCLCIWFTLHATLSRVCLTPVGLTGTRSP